MKTIIIIGTILLFIFSIKWLIETDRAYDYLERKTMWCYAQDGIMIEVHCFSKDMKLIEVPLNVIL